MPHNTWGATTLPSISPLALTEEEGVVSIEEEEEVAIFGGAEESRTEDRNEGGEGGETGDVDAHW